ncbi:MAG: hypothetical protein RI907_586 [Pseudomonadota bacterium]|jgi:hypothetical protein
MRMRHGLDRGWLWGALWVATLGAGAQAATPNWTMQVWGQGVVADGAPSKACPDYPGAVPYLFTVKAAPAGTGAELIVPGVLQPGHAYQFSFAVMAPKAPVALDAFFRKDGPYYDAGVIRTVQVTDRWQRVTLRGVHASMGLGSVRLALRNLGTAVCVAAPQIAEIAEQDVGGEAKLQAVSPHFFGVHLNKLGRHVQWPDYEPDVVRLWAAGTEWNNVQPSKDAIDWRRNPHAQRLEFLSKFVISRGRRSELIMTLGMTPRWAGRKAPVGACGGTGFGEGSCLPPEDMDTWRAFVRNVAARYKERIKIWEIWNESDVPQHWSGDIKDLVELTKVASEEIRRVAPRAIVIGPNFTSLGLRAMHEFLLAGGGQHVDGLSIHAYMPRSPGINGAVIRNLRESLGYMGLADKLIWNTESNTSCGATAPEDLGMSRNPCVLSPSEAIAQTYLLQASMGVQNISFYTWEGAEQEYGGSALVQADYETPTEAGQTMRALTDLLRGASVREIKPASPGVAMVEVVREQKVCRAAWSLSERNVALVDPTLKKWELMRSWPRNKPVATDEQGGGKVGAWPIVWCKSGADL